MGCFGTNLLPYDRCGIESVRRCWNLSNANMGYGPWISPKRSTSIDFNEQGVVAGAYARTVKYAAGYE